MTKTKKKIQKNAATRSESEDESHLPELANANSPASSHHEGTPESPSSSSLVLDAIKRMEHSMNERFDNLEGSLEGLRTSITSNTSRIDSLEETRESHDGRITELEKCCEALTKQNRILSAKLCDLEGRSRRQNVKIMGLPEKIEKGAPTPFVSDFLLKLLGAENFPDGIKVDRAHRVGVLSSKPRAMIAKIHHDSVKEKIIQVVRSKGPFNFEGKRISIFQDLAADVIKDRKEFDNARQKLRDAGIRNGFLFPARLIFTHSGETKIFSSPREAELYVNQHIHTTGNAAN